VKDDVFLMQLWMKNSYGKPHNGTFEILSNQYLPSKHWNNSWY